MSEDFNTALMLMAVGMITVFLILALIVLLGNGLILFINRFFPEKIPEPRNSGSKSIHPKKLAAIVAAVDLVTRGKGKVDTIKKL